MSAVLFPEDSGKNADQVLERVVRRGLEVVGLEHDVDLQQAPEGARRYAIAKAWGNKQVGTQLIRFVVGQILQGHVVVVHFDGDEVWSNRKTCKNLAAFQRIQRGVEAGLRSRDKAHRAAHLVPLVPFWEMEAWCYRDTARCLRWAPTSKLHLQAKAAPALLEETPDIKDVSPLRDQKNLLLVNKQWPAQAAYDDERSFRAFVDGLERAVVAAS